jgi:hypothetical protein
MVFKYPKHFISEDISGNEIGMITNNFLLAIETELHSIYNSYYNYNIEGDTLTGSQNIFRLIERTWIGILNNCVVKNFPNSSTLQEFSVWNSEGSIGRCDLLFSIPLNNKRHDFIVEGKLYEFTNNWKTETAKFFYNSILLQANCYYEAEKKYYDSYNSEVRLMAYVIEWIRTPDRLNNAKRIMDSWDDFTDRETDFLALYNSEKAGAFVYGKYVLATEFERV